jgi:hypothetical protein
MREMRAAILDNTFAGYAANFLANFQPTSATIGNEPVSNL